MIWFFLAGMVAGAVGIILYAQLWLDKHERYKPTKYEKDEKQKYGGKNDD